MLRKRRLDQTKTTYIYTLLNANLDAYAQNYSSQTITFRSHLLARGDFEM